MSKRSKQMFNKAITTSVLLVAVVSSGAAIANEAQDRGRAVYAQRCLHCHGENADGKGHLIEFLKVVPANLTQLKRQGKACVAERVLKAVIGRHTTKEKMPLLKDTLSPEDIYFVSEFIKSVQK
jgi:mono/diheme cytochrome c family protein